MVGRLEFLLWAAGSAWALTSEPAKPTFGTAKDEITDSIWLKARFSRRHIVGRLELLSKTRLKYAGLGAALVFSATDENADLTWSSKETRLEYAGACLALVSSGRR
jgi:hypothetical protein